MFQSTFVAVQHPDSSRIAQDLSSAFNATEAQILPKSISEKLILADRWQLDRALSVSLQRSRKALIEH